MILRIEHRRPGIGKYLEVEEDGWRSEIFGILNRTKTGEIDPGSLDRLEEEAEILEYRSSETGLLEDLARHIYGGVIETTYGRRKWIGSAPEDAEQYLEKVRDEIK